MCVLDFINDNTDHGSGIRENLFGPTRWLFAWEEVLESNVACEPRDVN